MITLIGRRDGKIVAKESNLSPGEAAIVERRWREAGLEVERVPNATEVRV